MALDLSHGHATGIEREDLLIKARPASLVLGDDLGLKAAQAIPRDFYGQLAKVSLEGFLALAVAGAAISCYKTVYTKVLTLPTI